MNIKNILPTPIGHSNDKEFTDKVLPIANGILKQTPVGNLGYKSTYGNTEVAEYLKTFDFIKQKILDISYEFIDEIGFKCIYDLEVDIFVSQMKQKDFHSAHNHPNSILSGIFYLELSPGSSALVFTDNKGERNFNGLTPKTEESISDYIIPKVGDCIIFEAWALHSVPRNNSVNRKTLVFNVHPRVI